MTVVQREQVITLGLALFMGGAFALICYVPRLRILQDVRSQITTMLHEIDTMSQRYEEMPAISQNVVELEAELQRALERLPQEDYTALFERDIRDLARRQNLYDTDFRLTFSRADATAAGRVHVKGVDIRCVSDFPRFFAFLQSVEERKEITAVDRVTIRPREDGRRFDISMDVSFYYGEL